MRVGVMAENGFNSGTFASDASHFIYCAEGETVQVDVLATFVGGTDCDDECAHGARTWEWEVSGASSYTLVSETYTVSKRSATFELSEAGDTVTITAKVGSTSQGFCDEDRHGNPGEHGGSHAGAQASCTIKLWRMDLAVGETNEDPEEEPYPLEPTSPYGTIYQTQFAKSATTTATLVGASPADVSNWNWQSIIVPPDVHETKTGGTSWYGRMVAPTEISVLAYVQNGCAPTVVNYALGSVSIEPNIRRPGWTTEVQLAASDTNWLSEDSDAFPETDWSLKIDGTLPAYGRLANARVPYDLNYTAAVVPIYADLAEYPSDYSDFSSKIEQITSGPNIGYYYNSDPTLYEIRRKILSNYWIRPDAGHPTTPSLDNDGNSYTNWLEVLESAFGEDCGCVDPSDHGGTGTGAWWRANLWHEGRGSPESPNKRLLGHASRLEDHFAANPRALVDPVYRCDLLYAEDPEELRAANEGERAAASVSLYNAIVELHNYVATNSLQHNFYSDLWIWETGPPPGTGWKLYSKFF